MGKKYIQEIYMYTKKISIKINHTINGLILFKSLDADDDNRNTVASNNAEAAGFTIPRLFSSNKRLSKNGGGLLFCAH